ncbi:MAG: flagellar export chaperone FliS [bacterium]
MNNPHKKYKQMQYDTASPAKLIQMLYEGAIKHISIAQKAIEEKKTEITHSHILKAQAIIAELMSSLNMEAGKEVAQNLFSLYEYMYEQLIQANIKKDKEKLIKIQKMLSELLETWKKAVC